MEFKGEANVTLYEGNSNGVEIRTAEKWYTRIWFFISNPLRYLFTGKVKF